MVECFLINKQVFVILFVGGNVMSTVYSISFGKGKEYIHSFIDKETGDEFINIDYCFPSDFAFLSVQQLQESLRAHEE